MKARTWPSSGQHLLLVASSAGSKISSATRRRIKELLRSYRNSDSICEGLKLTNARYRRVIRIHQGGRKYHGKSGMGLTASLYSRNCVPNDGYLRDGSLRDRCIIGDKMKGRKRERRTKF
jgi:hypothetical protein